MWFHCFVFFGGGGPREQYQTEEAGSEKSCQFEETRGRRGTFLQGNRGTHFHTTTGFTIAGLKRALLLCGRVALCTSVARHDSASLSPGAGVFRSTCRQHNVSAGRADLPCPCCCSLCSSSFVLSRMSSPLSFTSCEILNLKSEENSRGVRKPQICYS